MDKTVCRFDCWSVKESKNYKGKKQDEEITLSAATQTYGEDANTEINNFSMYTPSGRFEMTVTNPNVFGFFKPGFSYYLEISEVPIEKQSQEIQNFVSGKEQD